MSFYPIKFVYLANFHYLCSMKKSQDIELLRMASEIQSLQSRLAFYMERAESSVSREEYEAVKAERDAAVAESAAREALHREEQAAMEHRHRSEIEALNARLGEFQEAQALLQTENTDFKTLWEFWQRHHFGASSETMTDMMDKVVGKLPTTCTGMLADILSIVDRLNHTDGVKPLPATAADKEKNKGEDHASRKPGRKSAGRNCRKTKCLDVREILGPDLGDMPPGFKVITRKGAPDSMVIEILFMEKARTYSKKYTVVRCNIPGDDPRFTKYPPRLFNKVPVDPSFASFYLDMKFSYNIPESRILQMLENAGCKIPQATLNRWMHTVMEGLFETLMPEMKKAVRASRFTHNDETRILVRSMEKDEENPSYKTEYIHGILSPEANLFLMLYDQGSRAGDVQLDIFRESSIIAFLADRCPLYTALVTALSCHPLIRGACWVHFRRYLLHAYLHDKRLEPMVHLTARLFAAERIISGMKNLTETQRVRERQRMCRPLVEAMFAFMQKVRDAGTEYGVLARRAADYLLDDREGFSAFLTCGLMEIENNAVERCFRNIAKGRENWLQCGSHRAAGHTAFMYSLVESCKMNGLDFGLYIETVLRRILDGDTDTRGMLPNAITLPDETGKTSAA